MALTTYNFAYSAFANGKVASDRLAIEIAKSGSGISIAIERIDTDDGSTTCSVVMKTALSGGEITSLDAIVAAHDGTALQSESVDSNGYPVFAPSFLFADETARLKGAHFTALAGQTTFHDSLVTTELLVQGGQFWIKGASEGDSIDFAVMDKDDTLGLFSGLGLTVGVDVIELIKYIDHYPIPDEPIWKEDVIMPTVAPMVTGLYMRTIYNSLGVSDVKCGVFYRNYEAKT